MNNRVYFTAVRTCYKRLCWRTGKIPLVDLSDWECRALMAYAKQMARRYCRMTGQ